MSERFQTWLRNTGIFHRKTSPYSPFQNGVAERRNGVLQTMKDALLADAGISHAYWGEAVVTSCYIINRLYSSAIEQTPYYMLYGREPSIQHMRVFGCSAWVHVPKETKRKGKPKAKKMRFLGYERGSKAYRFLDGNKNVVISRSANFCEHKNWDKVHSNSQVYILSLIHI